MKLLNIKESYGVLDCTYFNFGTGCQNIKIANKKIEHLQFVRCSKPKKLD